MILWPIKANVTSSTIASPCFGLSFDVQRWLQLDKIIFFGLLASLVGDVSSPLPCDIVGLQHGGARTLLVLQNPMVFGQM